MLFITMGINLLNLECIKTFLWLVLKCIPWVLDFSTEGRNVTVIFGDGAGAVVLQPSDDVSEILTTKLHSNGTHAEELAFINPGCHGGYHLGTEQFGYPHNTYGGIFLTPKIGRRYDLPKYEWTICFQISCSKNSQK